MRLNEYQRKAFKTDQVPSRDMTGVMMPLLGIAGEVGTLLAEYKKYVRDGEDYMLFKDHITEEIGDILWYLSNIATKFEFKLSDIAEENLEKTFDRWVPAFAKKKYRLLDTDYHKSEQIPRRFEITFQETRSRTGPKIQLFRNGQAIGDELTNNSYKDRGYRFHDVFHLANAAILGWSPVMRKLLKCKRRSKEHIDEIEDGGRATVIEEGIVAFVFDYAEKNSKLRRVTQIDFNTLKTIRSLTSDLEVNERSYADWQRAIIEGNKIFEKLRANRGGRVLVDLRKRTVRYRKR